MNQNEINTNLASEDLLRKEAKLLSHYRFLYPEIYKNLYAKYKQEYESRKINYYEVRRLARNSVLNDLIEMDEITQIQDGTWACPICGLHIKDMGAHVKSIHSLAWSDFVQKYNWIGTKIYFSETYRENLSKNKLNYYNNTDRGIEAKKVLSKKFLSQNNPACRDEVKLKISKARLGQHMSTKNKEMISKSLRGGLFSEKARSYGYTFWEFVDGKEIRFRSKCEYLIYIMFKYYGMSVQHEPYKIEYFDPAVDYTRHYLVDYVYGNRLFEVKPKEVDFTKDVKYNLVQNTLNKLNKKLEILTPSNFNYVFNIDTSKVKPISFFESILIENIKKGKCKLVFPTVNSIDFYETSNFVKKIGGLSIIKNGELLYENKKSDRNN